MDVICSFYESASTEISPDGHTLSRHGALPSSLAPPAAIAEAWRGKQREDQGGTMRKSTGMAVAAAWLWMACVMAVPTLMASPRIPEVPTLRHIGVADGLPSSDVKGLAFDPDGYLWIATIDGLARYDGAGMQVWRHVPGDARSLPGNYLTVEIGRAHV